MDDKTKSVCVYCDRIIYHVQIRGDLFRWMTNPKRESSWRCMPGPSEPFGGNDNNDLVHRPVVMYQRENK